MVTVSGIWASIAPLGGKYVSQFFTLFIDIFFMVPLNTFVLWTLDKWTKTTGLRKNRLFGISINLPIGSVICLPVKNLKGMENWKSLWSLYNWPGSGDTAGCSCWYRISNLNTHTPLIYGLTSVAYCQCFPYTHPQCILGSSCLYSYGCELLVGEQWRRKSLGVGREKRRRSLKGIMWYLFF